MSFQGACPPILTPETQNCSGRGICVSATECLCPQGWTGVGDFAFQSPSCAINIRAVQALWAIGACVHLALVVFSIYFLRVKLRQKHQAIAAILLGNLVLVCSVSFCITGLIRAIDPQRTIGTDGLVTTFFCIGAAAFWSGSHTLLYAFIDLSLKQATRLGQHESEETKKSRMHLRISLPISNTVSFIACMLPFGMLTATNATFMQQLVTAHYVICAGELGVAGLILVPLFVRKIVVDIEEAISGRPAQSEALLRIVAKLKRFLGELRNQAIVNGSLAALFGFWPYLQVYGSSYFLPLTWTCGAILNGLALYVNLPISGSKSSSEEQGSSSRQVNALKAPSDRNLLSVPTIADTQVESNLHIGSPDNMSKRGIQRPSVTDS